MYTCQMGMIKKYIEYLKDNPEGYWFKRKLYGWGWTPATWQGWLVLFIFVLLIIIDAGRLGLISQSDRRASIEFMTQVFGFIVIFVLICYKKGEKPRWQWGIKK